MNDNKEWQNQPETVNRVLSPPQYKTEDNLPATRPSYQILPQRGGARLRVRYREGSFTQGSCSLCK